MNNELINEFYLLQQSRVTNKYHEVLEEEVYKPIKSINKRMTTWISENNKMTTWISERGHMLMHLEARFNTSMRHLRKKYLKF